MKTKKMSLANIKGKMSRAEMKNIMAGSGNGCLTEYAYDCTLDTKRCCYGLRCENNATTTGTICMY